MKYESISSKLITRVSLIFATSFILVLSLVAYMNIEVSNQNYNASEKNIKDALIAKGRTLANNNSQALKGMVEDNAFTAVVELVSTTVNDDVDIVYGIFMDIDSMAWVFADAENVSGEVAPGTILEDENSQWAVELLSLDYKMNTTSGDVIYEFAAPVVVDEEVLGVIRYGISTKTMEDLLLSASEASSRALMRNMMILIAVGLIAVIVCYLFTRRIAKKITLPLASLSETAETIASGNYSEEVNVHTNDEIGLLANNFETMRATIRKKMADLAKLNSTGEQLATAQHQGAVLEEVLNAMHDQIGVSHGSIYFVNEQDVLEIKGFYPVEYKERFKPPLSFKSGQGIIGKAAESGQIIYVEDTGSFEGFYDDSQTCQKPRSLLCIPLMDGDTLMGVMNCSGDIGEVEFEDADKEFAEAIARQLVITIKNIRMREVIEEQNRTLEHKVEQRTAELAQKTNDIQEMLENMHQGLFTVMDGGEIHPEYAAYLETILCTESIAGENFMSLLFDDSDIGPDQRNQVEVASDSIVGEDEIMFEFNSHLLIPEYQKQTPEGNKILELAWDPIVMDGTIEKLMVTVRDVTDIRELQGHAEAQKKELDTIGQILAVEPQKFESFIDSALRFVAECRDLITRTESKDSDVIATLFRNMHTVKGNSRTYGFSFITNLVHQAEDVYDALRKDSKKEWLPDSMLEDLHLVEREIERYQSIAHEKLDRKPSASDASHQGGLSKAEVLNLLDKTRQVQKETFVGGESAFLDQLAHTLEMSDSVSFEELFEDVHSSTATLAKQLDKEQPIISLEANQMRVRTEITDILNSVFMHVIRNSLDHGIEGKEERLDKGKPAKGNIKLALLPEEDLVKIVIEDDGRGLALDKIEQKARDVGMFADRDDVSDAEIANCIFSSGFSTAAALTDVSGRGVGMEAVKEFLESSGGRIDVLLSPGERVNGYRNFKTQFSLPADLFVKFVSKESYEEEVA